MSKQRPHTSRRGELRRRTMESLKTLKFDEKQKLAVKIDEKQNLAVNIHEIQDDELQEVQKLAVNIHEVLVDEMQEGQKIKELWQKVILLKEQTSIWKNGA